MAQGSRQRQVPERMSRRSRRHEPGRTGMNWLTLCPPVIWLASLIVVVLWPGQDHRSVNLIRWRPFGSFGVPIPLGAAPEPDGSGHRRHSVEFDVGSDAQLADARTLGLMPDVYLGRPDRYGVQGRPWGVKEGVLKGPDGKVWFRLRDGEAVRDERLMEFWRTAEVPKALTNSVRLRLELVSAAGDEHVAIWGARLAPGYLPEGKFLLGPVTVKVPGDLGTGTDLVFLLGRLSFNDDSPPGRRIDLLAFVWGFGGWTGPVWLVLILSAGLVTMGSLVWQRLLGGLFDPLLTGIAAFLLFAGLGLPQLLLNLPFSPPDEAGHFLSYSAVRGSEQMPLLAREWAMQTHLERRVSREYEHFAAGDMRKPWSEAWGQYISEGVNMDSRAPAASWFWRATGWLVPMERPSEVLLRVRMLHLSVVAGAVGVAAALLSTSGLGTSGGGLIWLLAPVLTCFGCQVSNYFLLIAGQIVVASALADAMPRDGRDGRRGLLAGVALGVVMFGSHAFVPLLGAACVLCLVRLGPVRFTGSRDNVEGLRCAWRFWGGMAVPLLLSPLLSHPLYDAGTKATVQRAVEGLGGPAQFSPPFWLLCIAVPAIGAAVEVLISRLREGWSRSDGTPRGPGVPVGRWIAVAIVAWVLLSSLLPPVELRPTGFYSSAGEFAFGFLGALTGAFRIGYHDFLSSSSFWSGFGYTDVILPEAVVSVAAVLTGLGWAARFWLAGGDARALWGSFVGLAACVAYAVFLALGAWELKYDLMSRYLVGFYVFLLVGAGIGWGAILGRVTERRWFVVPSVVGGVVAYEALVLATVAGRSF